LLVLSTSHRDVDPAVGSPSRSLLLSTSDRNLDAGRP